jgi:hypothetical protein
LTSNLARKCLAGACILAAATPGAIAQENPLARGTWGAISDAPIEGAWNGTDLERRSGCTSAQNDGSRGTYAEFDLTTDRSAHILAIDEKGITGLTCTYGGTYSGAGATLAWSGHYSCSDGKQGTFTSRSILVDQNALSIHLDVQLQATETCAIDKVIGAGRLYP